MNVYTYADTKSLLCYYCTYNVNLYVTNIFPLPSMQTAGLCLFTFLYEYSKFAY